MKEKGMAKNIVGIIVVVVIIIGCISAYVVTRPRDEEEEILVGIVLMNTSSVNTLATGVAAKWVLEDMEGVKPTEIYDAEQDAATQISIVRDLIETVGIDGLVWSSASPGGCRQISEMCAEAGVVNICMDQPVHCESEDTQLFITTDKDSNYGEVARMTVELLTEKYGEPRGTVLIEFCPKKYPVCPERYEYVKAVFEQYPEIEFHTDWMEEYTSEIAVSLASDMLAKYGKPDAMISSGGVVQMGVWEALNKVGWIAPKGEDGHVIQVTPFPNPAVLEKYKEGTIDGMTGSNIMYWGLLNAYYVVKGIREGVDALPKPGDMITADDVDISFIKPRKGWNPFAETAWVPAKVTEGSPEYGHPVLSVSAFRVPEGYNVDSPTLLPAFIELYIG